ncbi:hypothetical protein HHUSO_G15329 [Huso huso]|uniref:Uncharacterized protein n=1 Tax=Huso huso TaxID=61971 RepID=A0ABR0ZCB6_HUSHU
MSNSGLQISEMMSEGRLCNFTDEESRVLICIWSEDKIQQALNGQQKNLSLQQGVSIFLFFFPLKVRMLRVCSCEKYPPTPLFQVSVNVPFRYRLSPNLIASVNAPIDSYPCD